jgi:hypothetical protein
MSAGTRVRCTKAQYTAHGTRKTLALIPRKRVNAAFYMLFYGTPIIAVASCRFTTYGCQSDQLNVRLRSLVHI